ncbi:MAG: FeoA family protein [Candidatus Omnitrophota bacterium]
MKKISLVQIKANRKGRVTEVLGGLNLQNRLMSMGVFKGKEVTKLSHVGLRGPVVIKAGRSILALGHGVAAKVIINLE